MACKPYKTSEANAKSYLKTKGAIDAFLNILNLNTFRKENINLSQQARDKGVTFEGNIFLEDNGKAVPRKDLFKKIDTANGVYYQVGEPKVDFDLKVVNKVESNISKINGWFKQMKDTDQFWKKVQSDLAIPKEQVELLRQSEGDTVEQKLVDFVSKYSYTIKIDTAKRASEPKSIGTNGFIQFEINGQEYSGNGSKFRKGIYPISEEEFNSNYNKYMEQDKSTPTQHYSNLTVPGGTNYTENEISTPGITPSIKGHAEFSTDNGIGWFRSDDKIEFLDKEDLIRKGIIKQVPCG